MKSVNNNIYTGKVKGKIIYGYVKKQMLEEYAISHECSLDNVAAYADHESDIPMLKAAGHGFLVNPDSHMLHLAQREGLDAHKNAISIRFKKIYD